MTKPFSFFSAVAMTLASLGSATAGETIEMGSRGVSNFIATMEKERKAHVVFLGGSITKNQSGHSRMVANWLVENWSEVDFTFTNAGLSSTCSVTGAFRTNRDVLSQGPVDLLIVEFAVNDDQDAGHDRETAIRGLEGIVRQYRHANPTGDVISVQYVNPDILAAIQSGGEAVSVAAHKAVARHYDIPIVDVGSALAGEIEAGRMSWAEDYVETHPNQKGYRFASDLITKVIADTVSGETPQNYNLPVPLDPNSYFGASEMSPEEANWLGGWKYGPVSEELLPFGQIRDSYRTRKVLRSDEAGNYLYLSFQGRMLGAFVLAGPDAGALEASIDDGPWVPVELYHQHSRSLHYPRSVILADDLPSTIHRAVIRTAPSSNPESKGAAASILYFEVNE